MAVTLAGKSTPFTAALAFTYLGARILYVPAYYFGWVPWRSLIFAVGFLATVLMLLVALSVMLHRSGEIPRGESPPGDGPSHRRCPRRYTDTRPTPERKETKMASPTT